MSTERLLQIHLVALCLLGAIFVALSNPANGWVPFAVIGSGVVAIVFTDAWKWFRLHRLLANVAAIAAVAFSLQDFFTYYHDSQLLAIANLLVYLQLILFFQEKNDRIYWQIILLSLLQVVVGAALNLGVAFGGLLIVYTIISLSALVLFFLHREMRLIAELPAPLVPPLSRDTSKRSLLGSPPMMIEHEDRHEYERVLLVPRLAWQLTLIVAGAFLFSSVYFVTSPRRGGMSISPYRGSRNSQTGFSRNLPLQKFGELATDNSLVMRVWLENSQHKKLNRFEPYFQGETLRHYDIHQNAWLVSNNTDAVTRLDGPPLPAPPGSVLQHIRMEPTPDESLFTVAPSYALLETPTEEIRMDKASGLLYRKSGGDTGAYYFTVGTTGLVNNMQPAIVPYYPKSLSGRRSRLYREMVLEECVSNFEPLRFQGLSRIAAQWLEARRIKTRDPLLIARTLEEHFLQPGAYKYSLDMNIERDESLDPIEDFVVNRRPGHCQYFASALVMMLRSQGIPARMVVGYRGFEYNEVGGFYLVRQRHAHAWVEVFVEQDSIPSYETTGGPITEAGAWVRLDPTPSSDLPEGALARSWLGLARDWLDDLEIKWSDFVVEPNLARQNNKSWREWLGWDDLVAKLPEFSWRKLAAWFGIHFPEGTHGIRFDWWASISAMGFTVILIGLARLGSWLWKRWGLQQAWRWHRTHGRTPTVTFYLRLEKLLTRLGYERRPEQTPREYAEHCALLVDETTRREILAIVEVFYRIRFGEHKISSLEVNSIDHTITAMERRVLREAI